MWRERGRWHGSSTSSSPARSDCPARSTRRGIPTPRSAFLTRALEVAAQIEAIALSGVTYGTIGRTSGAPPTVHERDAVARVVEGGARAARERGLRFGVEPCNRYETHLVNTAADGVEIVERVARTTVFVHPDSYHMNIEEVGMALGIADAGGHLGYVHASESNRGVPGRGTLDWAGLCRGLAEAEFEVHWCSRASCTWDPDIAAGLAVWRPVAEHPEDVIDVRAPVPARARGGGGPGTLEPHSRQARRRSPHD